MIVISEAAGVATGPSGRDINEVTEAAKLAGFRVYHIPADFKECGDADAALAHIPIQISWTPGFWIGYVPTAERYHAIYEAAEKKFIRLINTPVEHTKSLEMSHTIGFVHQFFPHTEVRSTIAGCEKAAEEIGLPVFMRGAIKSGKLRGLGACAARNLAEVRVLAEFILDDPKSRGAVIVRKFLPLRHVRVAPNGFPVAREFRAFCLYGELVDFGYYWEGEDELVHLKTAEEHKILRLAEKIACALQVPFIAVDIAQTESGEWIVIETGDAQFCGVSQIPPLRLWHRLHEIMAKGKDLDFEHHRKRQHTPGIDENKKVPGKRSDDDDDDVEKPTQLSLVDDQT